MLDQLQESLQIGNKCIKFVTQDPNILPNAAKLMAKYRDALMAEGFTREEAIRIAAQYKAAGS